MNDFTLEVKNLSVEFNVRGKITKAVSNVSWHVNKGETLAIVGESGSGKSVSALSILKLIPDPPGKITSGSINFQGANIVESSDREIRDIRGKKISMIFQEPMTSLNPLMTIGKQISEVLERHYNLSKKESYEKAKKILAKNGTLWMVYKKELQYEFVINDMFQNFECIYINKGYRIIRAIKRY